jgi:DNA uptake protein ComE-like DNA-binding protein
MRTILFSFFSILLVFAAAFAEGRKATQKTTPKAKEDGWAELLPPGDGRELVLSSCASCHNLKPVVDVRKSRESWAKSINDMIQRGAPVFPEEIEPMTTYLSKAFGTDVPKLININTASREQLEKLPNLKSEVVARLLATRDKIGSFKNSEELRRTLGMDKADFEKILYLFKYSD